MAKNILTNLDLKYTASGARVIGLAPESNTNIAGVSAAKQGALIWNQTASTLNVSDGGNWLQILTSNAGIAASATVSSSANIAASANSLLLSASNANVTYYITGASVGTGYSAAIPTNVRINTGSITAQGFSGTYFGTGANITNGTVVPAALTASTITIGTQAIGLGGTSTIPPTALSASQVIIGTSSVSLGAQLTSIAGITSVSGASVSASWLGNTTASLSGQLYGTYTGTGANLTAGTVSPTALSASQVIIGTSSVSLGSQLTSIAGITSVSGASVTASWLGNTTASHAGTFYGQASSAIFAASINGSGVTSAVASSTFAASINGSGVTSTVASAIWSSSLNGNGLVKGSTPPGALSASQVIIGTSSVSLGAQLTTISGLTSLAINSGGSVTAPTAWIGSNTSSLTGTFYGTLSGTTASAQISSSAVLSSSATISSSAQVLTPGRTIGITGTGIGLGATAPTFDGSQNITITASIDSNVWALKSYVDGLMQGIDWKNSVRLATTADLSGTYTSGSLTSGAPLVLTIDGTNPAVGDRVLLKNQNSACVNGIYTVTASGANGLSAWTIIRSDDANVSADITAGLAVFVAEGTTNADSAWVLTTNDPITLDTTGLTFTQFSGLGQITASSGLQKSGNVLSVVTTDGLGINTGSVGIVVTPSTPLNITTSSLNFSYNNTLAVSSGSIGINTGAGYGIRKATGVLTTPNTTVTIAHGFGTRDVVVEVYDAVTFDTVETDVVRGSTASVTVNIASWYANNLNVVVIG